MPTLNLFIAPHSDDEALYGSYIILRNKPIKVVVCTDGFQHKEKFGIKIEDRREESKAGCKILGCEVDFLGLSDVGFEKNDLKKALKKYEADMVFAPLKSGGNVQHDMVSEVALGIWGEKKVWFYGNYSKKSLHPEGEQGFIPSVQEIKTKHAALICYTSQLKINKPHFDAAMETYEYLTYLPNKR